MKFFKIFIFIFIIFLKYFTIFGMFTPQSQRQLRKSSSAIVNAISKSPRQLRLMATGLNKSCVSGGAFVAKEADEVWNRKAYVISYKQLVSNLGEFESNTYTSKLDDFHRLLVSLERDLTRHLLPIVTLLKDMVNDYNNDEQGLSITENKIRGLRTNIEKILLNVLDGGEIMMTEEEDENVEENLSDFIHERTVYREMVQTLSPKYDKSYKLWLNEKRNLLEETKLCYLNNDILHQINQIDRLHKIYEENILQAKKLIGVTINSNQEETSIDEPSFWQRVSSQIGKISREIYYNLAKNIPIRKLKKG
ncbi:hypothetical protein Mgra_00007713 [Meloidogyne graminicola]|uniref:Uncharacterized protein n=1 Tax=Meloidogyne graminicola TaxID=189291 RepID=A0A8S9ZHS9_9BILA|nr:hypothetical protein Mgra_00007713 [Meloidogyne graminicola]